MTPVLLSAIEIQRHLSTLADWMRRGRALYRTFEFKDFVAALAFVNRAGDVAERMHHHPDMDIRYNTVTCHLSTHSAGGITRLDFELAKALDEVVK